ALTHNRLIINIKSTRTNERVIRKRLTEVAGTHSEAAGAAAPDAAPIIPGTGGIHKLRWRGSGRGKRGGIRAIYFWHAGPEAIYMLTAYAKAERDDLTAADRKALSKLVESIERGRWKR
ncbi:MAG: hypothetical protein F4Y02_08220, partial [Chloroflexi bacterium]|nr:hypothetical protein [Chloroflexota bacterium]